MKTPHWILLCLALAAAGYFLRPWIDGPPSVDPKYLESEKVVLEQQERITALLLEVAEADYEQECLRSLYLTLSQQRDTIRLKYEPLYARIARADADDVHRIADSLVAGYLVNRARYRMLLDGRDPLDTGRVHVGE